MIGTLTEIGNYSCIAPGIAGGISGNLGKEFPGNQPGTGEGKEHTTGIQQMKGLQHGIFVSPAAFGHIPHGVHQLGRIKYDQIKLPLFATAFTQK